MAEVIEQTALTPVEWIALRSVAKHADAFRDEVQPGRKQEVDFMLRVKGVIDVGEDGQSIRRMKPTADIMLAFALRFLETCQEPPTPTALVAAIQTACDGDGLMADVEEGYAVLADTILNKVSVAKTSDRKGAVRGAFQVGKVETAGLSATVQQAVKKSMRAIDLKD